MLIKMTIGIWNDLNWIGSPKISKFIVNSW